MNKELQSIIRNLENVMYGQPWYANREYNYRFLLNGLMQHNIYHLGQIAFLKNLLGE